MSHAAKGMLCNKKLIAYVQHRKGFFPKYYTNDYQQDIYKLKSRLQIRRETNTGLSQSLFCLLVKRDCF